jgi:hypothetical protein
MNLPSKNSNQDHPVVGRLPPLQKLNFKNLNLLLGQRRFLIVIGLVAFGIVGVILIGVMMSIGKNYAKRITINETPHEIQLNKQTFAINRVTVNDLDAGTSLDITRSGITTKTDTKTNILKAKKLLSNAQLAHLFATLTLEEFQALLSNYYSGSQNIIIIIETTFGTKTIIINGSGDNPPPPPIDDIIDDTNDIDDQLNDPTPTAPPLPERTPTPPPAPDATPLPTTPPLIPTSPTPIPSAIPFSCDMLNKQNVTVSNIRCVATPVPKPSPK